MADKLSPSNTSEPDFSRSGFGFSQVRFNPNGRTDLYGHGQSGAVILVTSADRVIGQGAVDAKGKWHISMAPAQPVGRARQEVHLQLLAYEPQLSGSGGALGNDLQMVDDVRLTVPPHAAPILARAKSRLAVQSDTSRAVAAYPPLPTRRVRAATVIAPIFIKTAGGVGGQITAAGKVQSAQQRAAAQIVGHAHSQRFEQKLEPTGSMLKRSSSMIVAASSTYGQAETGLSAQGGRRAYTPKNVQYAAGQSSDGAAGGAAQRSQRSQSRRPGDRTTPSHAPIILAQATGDGVMDAVKNWYKQSEKDYRDVIRKLSTGGADKEANRRQADGSTGAPERGDGGERRVTSGLQRLLESVLPLDWWKRMRDDTRVAEDKPAKKKTAEGGGSGEPLSFKGAESSTKAVDSSRAKRAKELAQIKQREQQAAARAQRERQQRLQEDQADRERLAEETRVANEEAARRVADARARAEQETLAQKAAAAALAAQKRKEKAAELARIEQEQLKEDQRRRLAVEAQTAKARALETAQAEAAAQKAREKLKAERALERARMLAQRQTKERRARAELNRRVEEQKRKFAAQQRLAARLAAQSEAKAAAAEQKAAAIKAAVVKAATLAAKERAAKEQAAKEKELALKQAREEAQRQARIEVEKDALAAAKARELAARRRKDELASRRTKAQAEAAAKAKAQAQADAPAKAKRQSTLAAAALAAKRAVDQKRKQARPTANESDKPTQDESLGSKVKRKFAFSIKEAKEAAAAALGAARAKIAKENDQKTRERRLALSLPTRRQVDQGTRAGIDDDGDDNVGVGSAARASSGGRRRAATEAATEQGPQRLAQKSTAQTNTKRNTAASDDRGDDRPVNKRSCKNAGLQIDLPGWYVVRRGDTLRTIARQHYRSSRARRLIYRANEDRIDDLDDLRPCTRVRLPLPEPAG